MSSRSLPARARIVIIGGGVGGTSVAYHLAKYGERDVVLLDRNELTSGSTFHSAGLVGQLRADPTLTRMNMYSVELYRELQKSDTPPSWNECGSIKLASSKERLEEIHRQIGWARTFDLDLHEISAKEAQDLFPLMSTEGVAGACFLPTDGQVDPSQLAHALANSARANGVQIFTHTRVLAITTDSGRVKSVQTDKGDIECEVVVNCGGLFAPSIGRLVDVRIPIIPMSHQYVVTDAFMERPEKTMPSLRDPDLLVYYRQEVQGLVMGGYERQSKPWTASHTEFDQVPADFNGRLLPEDWDRFEEIATNSQRRVPKLSEVGVRTMINGPEGFTPDNEFCLGETEVGGFYVAAGFCAHGIAGTGGIGKAMAEWIIAGEPTMDLWHMDIRRFGAQYNSPSFTLKRTVENYETYYDIHYPGEERQSGRPLKVPPAYSWHQAHNASFGEKAGWERVNYYEENAGAATTSEALRPRGWAGRYWSPAIAAEHHATRNTAGIFDESSFAKFSVQGERAADFLQTVCANDVAKGAGKIVYTQALNSRGGIECDFTVTQTEENAFLIVTGTAFGTHDLGWLKKQRRELGFSDVILEDVTGRFACIGLWGPNARKILETVTPQDVSNEGFPFMTSRMITIGDVPTRASRITYVGELGWELYCSSEYALVLWQTLIEAGKPFGLTPCGYKAIDTMRQEKGYRAWSGEIGSETNPYEAGLGFAVALNKPFDFVGRTALELSMKDGVQRILRPILIDDITRVALGNEPVRHDGTVIGRIKSGGQGHSINKSIAFAYLPKENAEPGTKVEIEIFGEWVEGTVAKDPLFDPKGDRIKA